MTLHFKSAQQEALFGGVLRNLQRLGYRGELLQTEYSFLDWFQPDNPSRVVPAAAFGQSPQSYDSACFAVLLPPNDGNDVECVLFKLFHRSLVKWAKSCYNA